MSLELRLIRTHEEYAAVEALQHEVWSSGERNIVPTHMLLTAQKNGGLVLGAFEDVAPPPQRLVGFVFSFVGLTLAGRPKHCSHQLGVRPGLRDRQVGAQLKLAQREFVLRQGLDLITWTYDPLESRNAHLNIRKLGCTCRTYLRNLYGEMSDSLNAGLPSDRFQVDWHIASTHVAARLAGVGPPDSSDARLLNPAPADDPLAPAVAPLDPAGPRVLVRFPADFQTVKTARPAPARAWRFQVRELCEAAFAAGYTVIDLRREGLESYYLLEKDWSPS